MIKANKEASFPDGSLLQLTQAIDSIRHVTIDADSIWHSTLQYQKQRH